MPAPRGTGASTRPRRTPMRRFDEHVWPRSHHPAGRHRHRSEQAASSISHLPSHRRTAATGKLPRAPDKEDPPRNTPIAAAHVASDGRYEPRGWTVVEIPSTRSASQTPSARWGVLLCGSPERRHAQGVPRFRPGSRSLAFLHLAAAATLLRRLGTTHASSSWAQLAGGPAWHAKRSLVISSPRAHPLGALASRRPLACAIDQQSHEQWRSHH